MFVVPGEPEVKISPSFPVRSIPYSSYLKRYVVSTTRSANHRNPYLPPPRVIFAQSQVRTHTQQVLCLVFRWSLLCDIKSSFFAFIDSVRGHIRRHPKTPPSS